MSDAVGTKILSIRLDERQAAYLTRLARESGRSQAQVLARLVTFANNDPDAQRFLGIYNRATQTQEAEG